jgi:hypothetical protein
MTYATQLFTNNAVSLLAAPMTATDTTFVVMHGYGEQFPQPIGDGTDFFLVTLEDQSATVREIIRVIGRAGDTFMTTALGRAQEGTVARAWGASAGNDTLVDHRITAETMRLAMFLPVPGSVVPPGAEVVDDSYSFVTGTTNTTLTASGPYAPNSTKIHVAGLRLKRGVDFTETDPSAGTITLNFVITQANMDDGSNVVLDFVAA